MTALVKARLASTIAAMALMLGGCALGDGYDGFPDPESSFVRGGTLESSRAIETIQAGMTKDQVRDVLGSPHFYEGLFNVRTWNYLFDLGAEDGHPRQLCQLRLAFDGAMRVEEMRWRTAKCAVRFSAIQAEPIESASEAHFFSLPIDGMFESDGALTEEGRRVMGEFATLLKQDFLAPSLSIASFPASGQYHRHRQAVRRVLSARHDIAAEQVQLTDEAVSPCRGIAGIEACQRTDKIVIEVR